MNDPTIRLESIKANGITMRYAEAGSGPLVLFCHGWPEGWASWRHQIEAVARAGYRAVAPDMRGYGGTDAPAEIDRYTILDLVGDQACLVKALGETSAVVVGHDWGAPVAWHCALFRPDMFRAVVGMSVPWTPPGHTDLLSSLEKLGIRDFYIQYFQAPGIADAELDKDPAESLRRIYFDGFGNRPDRKKSMIRMKSPGGLLANIDEPGAMPDWLPADHMDYMIEQFRVSGFRGGLNWYRNLVRNFHLGAAWRGEPIRQPSLFIAGSHDGVMHFPASKAQIEAYPKTLPGCRGVHLLDGAGHWIQQERPEEVNDLLIAFLKGL
ncbi:alpha/beta hydrolase [Phreatobacter aquaticus]|uniref:Alpha/beta hydrolase n=1 Tax=Phreatobacter aquaticus TaxID=2570229 RepID=A0A4D7QP61_9HYPH|nr:alpha/beta hydrolase [Phreatobacter aquaticus]QCK88261.1 alpha/beta hydrolase [Phreatobacter aquaticus]